MGVVERLLRNFSRRFIYERNMAPRLLATVAARFRVRSGKRASSFVPAKTVDLSATGLGLQTKVLRVDGLHAYDSMDMVSPTRLDIELDLPGGTVALVGEATRYDDVDGSSYLLGVRIVEISDAHRRLYDAFVRKLARR